MELFDEFYRWIREYNYKVLIPNIEKEVEVKFVIPLFQKLGYPDESRRQEYHIKSHKKSREGDFADFVYFSELEPAYQNGSSSLVIVEAKKLEQSKLETAITQVTQYGAKLKSPLLIVTNGFTLRIIQRKSFEENQVIINSDVENLKDYQNAKALYEYLNFSKVKDLKKTLSDPIEYKQFIQQKKLLATYPDILVQLNQDSFEPHIKRENNKITVTRTRVSVICELPQPFYGGSCQITFSRPFLHGMSFALDHKTILKSLLVGLNQDFRLGFRTFVQKTDSGKSFLAQLGDTTLLLTEDEANDLCSCVDEIFTEYKDIIESTEDILQTWNYPRVENEYVSGFHIITIPRFLWVFMLKFVNAFDYGKGDSEWHIFQYNSVAIYVYPHSDIHVILQSQSRQNDYNDQDEIEVIYHPYTESSFRRKGREWFNNVGANGIWTITYTKNWLLNRFIPKVLEYYSDQINIQIPKNPLSLRWKKTFYPPEFKELKVSYLNTSLAHMIWEAQNQTVTSLFEIENPVQLDPYIRDIGNFKSSGKIALDLVKPYYASMLQLIKYSQPVPSEIGYMYGKLRHCKCYQHAIDKSETNLSPSRSFEGVLEYVTKQIHHIERYGYETSRDLDMISRVFLASLTDKNFSFTQTSLNQAISAIEPIWKEARFELRYISELWYL